jgi:DNA-directed RNA polymerase subunit beta
MTSLAATFTRPRKSFAKIPSVVDTPYLIEIQKTSYDLFLQADVEPDKRQLVGLEGVFRSVFPIKDFSETASVEFVSYSFEEPKYSVDECRQRGMSYSAPLKVVVRLVVWDVDKDTAVKSVRDVKEQEVYFGEIPLMTADGTFVINGTERVIVSQLHRSSGVFFDHDKGRNSASGKLLYTARVIPYRGSWLDFEFDSKDILYVRIDRRRKLHATVLLKALGLTDDQILSYFYKKEEIRIVNGKFERRINYDLLRGQRAVSDMIDSSTGKVIVKRGRRISVGAIRQLQQAGIESLTTEAEDLYGKIVADVVTDKSGAVVVPLNTELAADVVKKMVKAGVQSFNILFIDGVNVDASRSTSVCARAILRRSKPRRCSSTISSSTRIVTICRRSVVSSSTNASV